MPGVNLLIRRDRLIAVAVVLAAAAAVAIFVATSARSGGPLTRTEVLHVAYPAEPGQSMTWGTVLPSNDTLVPIVIESIEPVDIDGLDVLGIGVSDPVAETGIGFAYGFPPDGVTLTDPRGVEIRGVGGDAPVVQVLFGLRLADGSSTGSIAGIRVRYEHDGTRYEDVLPYSFEVSGPGQ